MKKFVYTLTAFCLSTAVFAQQPPADQGPKPGPKLPDARMFLELTEDQIAELKSLHQTFGEQAKPVMEAIHEQKRIIEEQLNSASPDVQVIGAAVVAIRSLEKQAREIKAAHNAAAVEVLTPEQQEKLNPLRLAAVLHQAARQAIDLGLIDPGQRPEGAPEGQPANGAAVTLGPQAGPPPFGPPPVN